MREIEVVLITKFVDGTDVKEKRYKVYAHKKSLSRSEFYAAYAAGLKPQMILDVLPIEYAQADVVDPNGRVNHATRIFVEGHEMAIIRTYEKSSNSMEMTVG